MTEMPSGAYYTSNHPLAKLPCGHTLLQHQRMIEAKASSELEGAKTDKSICELIDMSEPKTWSQQQDQEFDNKFNYLADLFSLEPIKDYIHKREAQLLKEIEDRLPKEVDCEEETDTPPDDPMTCADQAYNRCLKQVKDILNQFK